MIVKEITDDTFTDETSSGTVIIDFWAEWCGPCRILSPIVAELAKEIPTVQFKKINVDENPAVAQSLGITAIPTLVIYKDGKPIDRVIGLMPKEQLRKIIQSHI